MTGIKGPVGGGGKRPGSTWRIALAQLQYTRGHLGRSSLGGGAMESSVLSEYSQHSNGLEHRETSLPLDYGVLGFPAPVPDQKGLNSRHFTVTCSDGQLSLARIYINNGASSMSTMRIQSQVQSYRQRGSSADELPRCRCKRTQFHVLHTYSQFIFIFPISSLYLELSLFFFIFGPV
jgi:hypothetical protein